MRLTCLSDQTVDWKQPGDVGDWREAGGRLFSWGNRSEQHLSHGGECPGTTTSPGRAEYNLNT